MVTLYNICFFLYFFINFVNFVFTVFYISTYLYTFVCTVLYICNYYAYSVMYNIYSIMYNIYSIIYDICSIIYIYFIIIKYLCNDTIHTNIILIKYLYIHIKIYAIRVYFIIIKYLYKFITTLLFFPYVDFIYKFVTTLLFFPYIDFLYKLIKALFYLPYFLVEALDAFLLDLQHILFFIFGVPLEILFFIELIRLYIFQGFRVALYILYNLPLELGLWFLDKLDIFGKVVILLIFKPFLIKHLIKHLILIYAYKISIFACGILICVYEIINFLTIKNILKLINLILIYAYKIINFLTIKNILKLINRMLYLFHLSVSFLNLVILFYLLLFFDFCLFIFECIIEVFKILNKILNKIIDEIIKIIDKYVKKK